jgi:RND family efflux transporter MFP subunit
MKKKHLSAFALPAVGLAACLTLGTLGCAHDHDHSEEAEEESWAVTAWGDEFEIFAETGLLAVGSTSVAFTHVTLLDDFSPLIEGTVSVVLRGASGAERVFSIDEMTRPGIFSVPVTPEAAGEFDLAFRVETAGPSPVAEEILAGRVRVGEASAGGGLVEAPPVSAEAEAAATSGAGAEISFLKEQQWRTEFATAWLAEGTLRESVRGPGRVEPAAGGEVILTSPLDGVVSGNPWPYPGHGVARGGTVLRVTPRVASERSLAELEADVASLEAESAAARQRLERLEGLLELGATSRREAEEALARDTALASRLEAARKDLETARSGRRGASASAESIAIRAPFAGRIARIDVTPGQAVAAGAPLGLMVRESPLWVAVALRPETATRARSAAALDVRLPNDHEPLTFRGDELRLVSVSPAVDPQTGTVTALFEVAAEAGSLPIGTAVEAEILLAGERAGIVVPETALVDDGGVPVVYLQSGGEGFVRAEVEVLVRQSGMALVEGLAPGVRIVERGGNAIRRATLVSQDVGEGHIH